MALSCGKAGASPQLNTKSACNAEAYAPMQAEIVESAENLSPGIVVIPAEWCGDLTANHNMGVMQKRSFAIAILFLAAASPSAMAQAGGTPDRGPAIERPLSSGGPATIQAPIGHRQPTLNDLPPALQREEGPQRRTQQRRGTVPSTGVPQICKGC
jgi:hypothetical protein